LSFPAVGLMSELSPFLLTALRFAIACAGLWWLARRSADFWPAWRVLPLYALMGLCLAGFFGAMFWAAQRPTALSMATLYVTVPLLAYLLGLGFRVERLEKQLPGILAFGACGALALAFAEAQGHGEGIQLGAGEAAFFLGRSEEHTSELQSRFDLVCRLLLEKKKRERSYQGQEEPLSA